MKNTGEVNKEKGMERAIGHAEKVEPNWGEKALKFVDSYPYRRFMAEDVREWAYKNGLPVPPHCRAWGSVITKAARSGMIARDGFMNVKNPKAHSTPAAVWVKTEAA